MTHAPRTRRKKIGVPASKSLFTAEMLLAAAQDLQSGRLKLERLRFSDDMVVGLRAVVNRSSGLITLHATYEVGDRRPMIKLGDVNKDSDEYISIEDARELTKTIKSLGDKGIDVEDGLHKRLLRELREKGTSWRPK